MNLPSSLRGSRLLILNLQFVHHLLNVWNGCRESFGLPALGLRVDLAGQRDDMVFDRVLYAIMQLALNESGIQVLLDALIQIRIYGPGIAFVAQRYHRNLVRYNLSARDGSCNGFRLSLVAQRYHRNLVRYNLSARD